MIAEAGSVPSPGNQFDRAVPGLFAAPDVERCSVFGVGNSAAIVIGFNARLTFASLQPNCRR
jgi:hypothetical protein